MLEYDEFLVNMLQRDEVRKPYSVVMLIVRGRSLGALGTRHLCGPEMSFGPGVCVSVSGRSAPMNSA